jgi:Flp pilus assembly protein TadD
VDAIVPAGSGHPCEHPDVAHDSVPPREPDREPEDEPPAPGEPESAYDLLRRGTALAARRHHAQAAVVLARAARLEPGKGSILEALGRAHFHAGQHDRAAETFATLLDVDPSSPYGHFALGQSLKRLGRTDEARTHLRLAVALSPGTPLYRQALARLPGPGA